MAHKRASLKEAEAELFRLLVGNVTDYAIFILDTDGLVASWNPGAERIKGYKADEIIGQHFSRFYPQDAIDRGWPAHELAFAKAEGHFEDEGWRVRKDGSRFWANVVITAIKDEDGELRGFSKITRDLSERKKAEENARRLLEEAAARRAAEENVRLIQEQRERLHVTLASIGDAVISTNAQGQVEFLNPVAENLVGWKTEEAARRTLEDVFRIVNETTRQPVENPAMRALTDGMIVGLANHTVLIAKDGKERPIDDSAAPIRDASGNIIGSVLVFRDISDRRRAEAKAQEQQEWLRVTLASIGDAVIATDTQGRVTFLNSMAERLTGWTQTDAQGQPLHAVFAILHERTRQPVENPVEKVLRDGAIVGLGNHTVLIAKDGTERPIDDSAAPIRDMAGRLIGVVLTFRDVTEQRRNERQVRQSDARKTAILETALDCIITMDHQGSVVEFNPAAEKTFGYSRDQAIGQELSQLIIPPSLRESHRKGMAHFLATGEGPVLSKRLELPALRADGTEFPVELAITLIPTDGPPLFTAYLRDISERVRTEQRRNVRLAVTHALSEAASVEEGASGVLRSVCENLGWDVGFLWLVREQGDSLVCRSSWHREDAIVSEFEKASCGRTFVKGEGLPGRVWQEGKPAWILDVSQETNFPRLASAAKHDLHSAVAYPIVVGDHTIGLIEFFTEHIRQADADLLETMGTVAGNIGQFIERKVAEEELRRREQELADFFENATVGLHWVGPDGKILRANRAELDMLGYSREEYVGRPISDFHCDEDVIGDILNRLQAGEKLTEYPAKLRCKDGSIKDVLIDSSVLWRDGQFVHTRCFTRDVTDRKRAEAAVKASAERLNLALSAAALGDWSWDVASDIVTFSQQAANIFGLPPGPHMTWTAMQELLHEDDRDHARLGVERAVAEQVPYDIEYRVNRADGSQVWVAALGRAIYDASGQVQSMYGVVRDITERKRTEAALRHSEERFRSLMEQAPFSVQVFSPDGRTIRVNRAWEELWGVRLDQIEGYNVLEDRQLEAKGVLSYIHEGFAGQPARIPAIQYNPNETIPDITQEADPRRWLSAVIYPLKDADGRVREVVLIHEDITARYRAEEALRESERRFRQLADSMPQIVWTARPDGEIDFLNRRWTEFTGLPQSVGNEGWAQILHPDEAQSASERWAASVQSGAPFEMEMRLLDRRQRTYRWHLIRTVAVHDESGKVARWFGTGTDIHEQKLAGESSRYLAEASAALANVVDYESTLQKIANLAVPYFADWSAVDVVEGEGLRRLAVAHQDPAKVQLAHELMHQYPPDPQSPSGVAAVVRTGKPVIVSDLTNELLVQGAKDDRHLGLIRSLGLKSYICVPLVVSGNTFGALTFATAESSRRYTEADLALATDLANRAAVAVENTLLYLALRETDRRKDEFLATLAHELRNPLAPIRNALQILKIPRVDEESVGRSRDMMERQVDQLVRLVDDLLDVSRVMRGKIEIRRERVELATVLARAVETVQPLIDSQGHELSVRLTAESLPVDADPLRLTQVVGNLLTNAAKYTEPNGRIWLTAERTGDMAVLRVRDTGIGIDAQMLSRIFELFVQADHASTKAHGGLGIGLTLVKNLVEMHNGAVEARSAGLGKGSEFVVRLPLSATTPNQDDEPGAQQQVHQQPTPSGYRLLVVDDNQDAANSLAMLLKLQGHEVRVAFSGMAALEITKTYFPDVVFLDIGMPGMDGYEVARRLRQQPGLREVVLAALTGWGQQEDRRRSAEAGFNHHLVKPPDPNALATVLADLKPRGQ